MSETAAPCPARDGGFSCDKRVGHRGDHRAVVRHSWPAPDRPVKVTMSHLGNGLYGFVLHGERYLVTRMTWDSVNRWDVTRAADGMEKQSFTTLADVRRWAALSARPSDLDRERDEAELNGSMDRGEGMP